jgi:hypothetical protein
MTLQLDTVTRNNMLDSIETSIGASPVMYVRTGAVPANCAAADSGTIVSTINLPSDWMAAASGGTKGILGTWQDTSADNSGTAGHWRVKDSGGTVRMQGTCTSVGGGGDMEITPNATVTAGQEFNISGATLTALGG